jgi:integrase
MAISLFEIKAAQPREKAYRLADGRSLFVVVHPSGSKSFEFRYRRGGKLKAIVLGAVDGIGLKEARDERDRLRAMLADGLDPIDQRRIVAEEQRAKVVAARAAAVARRAEAKRHALTLKVVADVWVADTRPHWTPKHADQVEQSLRDHVYPTLGGKPIAAIGPGHILDLLGRLLTDGKVETARRVRQRLDAIFEYAGLRHDLPTNPVAMAKREINKRIKAARKANPEEEFACVPIVEVPQLLRAMRSYVGTPVTRTLLWFVALTACRTGEARYATWDEFTLDGDDPHWLIPARRMKAGRAHRVPLAPPVVTLLRELQTGTGKRAFVFPHPRRDDRPASENAVLYALAAIGYKDRMTGHGFRSLFSTLANGSHLHDPEIIEVALAHGDEDVIRGVYNRSKRVEEQKALADMYGDDRRRLANWYADELERLASPSSNVVSIKQIAA